MGGRYIICHEKQWWYLSYTWCPFPGTQLFEANQQLQFENNAEDLKRWLEEVEWQATSEDYGKGLADVQNLLKKHNFLESGVAARQVCC